MDGTVYIAPPYAWCILAGVIAHLATAVYMMSYLKRAHPDTWTRLGCPSLLPDGSHSPVVSYSLLTRFLFGRSYRLLNDKKLNSIIWADRLLLALFVLLTAVGYVFNLMPAR